MFYLDFLNGINEPINIPLFTHGIDHPRRRFALELDRFPWTDVIYPETSRWARQKSGFDDLVEVVTNCAHLPLWFRRVRINRNT